MSGPVVYHGIRTGASCFVWRDDGSGDVGELDARHDVRNHSPDGFEWGYGGSGPAQLALALTLDVLGGDVARARLIYQEVKWRIVGRLPHESWQLRASDLAEHIAAIEAALAPDNDQGADDGTAGSPDSTGTP